MSKSNPPEALLSKLWRWGEREEFEIYLYIINNSRDIEEKMSYSWYSGLVSELNQSSVRPKMLFWTESISFHWCNAPHPTSMFYRLLCLLHDVQNILFILLEYILYLTIIIYYTYTLCIFVLPEIIYPKRREGHFMKRSSPFFFLALSFLGFLF